MSMKEGLFIVNRDFFAGPNIAPRKEQHVSVSNPHESIRLATVIDVMRAITTQRSIQAPAAVNITNAQKSTRTRSLLSFEVGDALSSVLSDFPSASKWLSRKTTLAVDL
jgi:hypothetical protein